MKWALIQYLPIKTEDGQERTLALSTHTPEFHPSFSVRTRYYFIHPPLLLFGWFVSAPLGAIISPSFNPKSVRERYERSPRKVWGGWIRVSFLCRPLIKSQLYYSSSLRPASTYFPIRVFVGQKITWLPKYRLLNHLLHVMLLIYWILQMKLARQANSCIFNLAPIKYVTNRVGLNTVVLRQTFRCLIYVVSIRAHARNGIIKGLTVCQHFLLLQI